MSEEARKQALVDAAQALVDAVHEFVYPPDENSRLRILGDYMKTAVGRDKLATSMLMPARLKAWGRNHRLSEEESRALAVGQHWARGALDGYALLGQEFTLEFYEKVIQGLVTRLETQMASKPVGTPCLGSDARLR